MKDKIKQYKAITGEILKKNRLRRSITIEEACLKTRDLSPADLIEIEEGKKSPRGYQLYDLLWSTYRPTLDEAMFFCLNINYHQKTLSQEFKDTYGCLSSSLN